MLHSMRWLYETCVSRKCSYFPYRRDVIFLGRGGFLKGQTLLNTFRHLIGISIGVGVLRINPFGGRGMDDLWKYTKRNKIFDPQFFLGCLANHFLVAYLITLVWREALVVRVIITQENNTITLSKLINLMV